MPGSSGILFFMSGTLVKNVLIATPCLYGKVDAYYVHSLCESIKLGLKHDLNIRSIFLANESILPMARNELLNLAYVESYDTVVFVDDDEYWKPECLIEVIQSPKDVVAVPVVNKTDAKKAYNINLVTPTEKDSIDGYLKADTVGTGFLKLSKKVVKDLYESSPELIFRNKPIRTICEYTQQAGSFVGEDINLSHKIKELNYTIWVNPNYTISHLGPKMYKGDFKADTLK
jgi:hypothetical protein